MKTPLFIFILVIVMLAVYSCSYRESFIVANDSNEPVIVHYTLYPKETGFPIFTNRPSMYGTNKSGEIDWEKLQAFADSDSSAYGVKVELPPHSILIFGHLSNDRYTKYNQEFINGRIFNLERMQISRKGPDLVITGPEFDTYFSKKKGHMQYRIK